DPEQRPAVLGSHRRARQPFAAADRRRPHDQSRPEHAEDCSPTKNGSLNQFPRIPLGHLLRTGMGCFKGVCLGHARAALNRAGVEFADRLTIMDAVRGVVKEEPARRAYGTMATRTIQRAPKELRSAIVAREGGKEASRSRSLASTE